MAFTAVHLRIYLLVKSTWGPYTLPMPPCTKSPKIPYVFVLMSIIAFQACASDGFNQVEVKPDPPEEKPEPPADEDPPEPEPTPDECLFYAIDGTSSLWKIDTHAPSATLVGDTGVESLTDIAIQPDGTIIAHTQEQFFELSRETGAATLLGQNDSAIEAFGPVAADARNDSELLVGGEHSIALLNLDTNTFTELGDVLPPDWLFAGDISMRDSASAYATAKKEGEPDHLFLIDLVSLEAEDLGSLQTDLVWGLDYGCDDRLYGLITKEPLGIMVIEPDTMTVQHLGNVDGPSSLWGAAGPR